jgi:hypothetical protein
MGGPVAQWITRLTTDQKIAGSNPARIGKIILYVVHGVTLWQSSPNGWVSSPDTVNPQIPLNIIHKRRAKR